ncbi:MAG: PilZ domain-containing protein [Acidiferrobacterales bacterium]
MPTSTEVGGTERRVEPRLPIAHQFTIAHEAIGEVSCDTRDLSLKGAYVEGDFNQVSIGSTVAVSFILTSKRPGSDKATRYRFSAIIVRADSKGAGLNFTGLDTTTDAAIYNLMHR